MSFDLAHIWAHMGIASRLIAGALGLMALLTLTITLERLWALTVSAKASRDFAPRASVLVEKGDFGPLVGLAEQHKKSTLARLFGAVLGRFALLARDPAELTSETLKAEAVRQQETVSADIRRGLGVLATIGSLSPFVGLLGTVVGIISAFQGIGDAGSAGLGAVSVGISEALVETALGLVVAIPTVVAFNYLSQRISAVEGALGRSTGRLIDELIRSLPRSRGASERATKGGSLELREAA
jgi:biopolymer transport protein ExbB